MKKLPPFEQIRWVYYDLYSNELDLDADRGYAHLVIEFKGGKVARINSEGKLLRAGIDAVYLGADFRDLEYKDPGDPKRGRPPRVLKGVTGDPSVVQLTKEFLAAISARAFEPRIVYTGAKPPGKGDQDKQFEGKEPTEEPQKGAN